MQPASGTWVPVPPPSATAVLDGPAPSPSGSGPRPRPSTTLCFRVPQEHAVDLANVKDLAGCRFKMRRRAPPAPRKVGPLAPSYRAFRKSAAISHSSTSRALHIGQAARTEPPKRVRGSRPGANAERRAAESHGHTFSGRGRRDRPHPMATSAQRACTKAEALVPAAGEGPGVGPLRLR